MYNYSMNLLLILFGKIVIFTAKILNLGNGSTWPGHIALSINKNFLKDTLAKRKFQIILVAGTNGKTTTSKLIKNILEKFGKRVFKNESGANLINGVASSIINNSDMFGKLNYDFAIFEIDENNLPIILKNIAADFTICLNLFRDQLDRYGEVNTISDMWKKAFLKLPKKTKLILNADDPQIASLGINMKNSYYFGLNEKTNNLILQHASDSIYCPLCNFKLTYKAIYFSHLGKWKCENCEYSRPDLYISKLEKYPLPGKYNKYNALGAVLLARLLKIDAKQIDKALEEFTPAFGRQEIIKYKNKKIQIFLSKNPASFNQSLQTVKDINGKNILIVLNSRIPDGRDISWIWDVDFELFIKSFKNISISGDRVYDMALRIRYCENGKWQPVRQTQDEMVNDKSGIKIYENLKEALGKAISSLSKDEILYVLPTYSAMLDVRKILTGRSIL